MNVIKRRDRKRQYSLNENAFNKCSLESCYWAGYIASDGCIKYSKRNIHGQLSFHINKRDEGQLILLKKFLGANNPIYHYSDNSIELSINKIKNIAFDLKKQFNITQRKSLTLIPPNIFGKNALAFIIGYLDGDGCITSNGDKLAVNFRGTKKILYWIKKHFDNLYIGKHYCVANPVFSSGYWSYTVSRGRARRILNILKKIHVPKMNRKWNKI